MIFSDRKAYRNTLLAILGPGLLSPMGAFAQEPEHSPKEVLLIFNAGSLISANIARDYAKKRGITNVLSIHCRDSAVSRQNETIPWADYSQQIAAPVRKYLDQHKEINFIVLTKGVPIRIDGGETGSKDERSTGNLHPSVDSYLAAIDYPEISDAKKIRITGSGATGYVWLNRYWKANTPFTHARFGGYLVTRLDGYTQADAMTLVDRSLQGESEPLKSPNGHVLLDVQPGFGIDHSTRQPFDVSAAISRESPWGTWNADLVQAADLLKDRHISVTLDRDPAFVGNQSDLLGYFSWGSNDSHFTAAAYESLTFAPGSIGDTAVSTSARTFLPTTGGQSLIADLIAHGITAVKGYVNEPLLQANASPSLLLDRYSSGYTMAESVYAASRFIGWEDIVIGDPLGRLPALGSGKDSSH